MAKNFGVLSAFLFVLTIAGFSPASATPIVIKGTLAQDDTVLTISLLLSQTSDLTAFTTSYGGGTNLDGTITAAGGFEPILSLFSPSGAFLADDGGDLFPHGAVDPTTGVAGDAFLHLAGLSPGSYTLALTEFFNFPNGNLSDGFFEAGQGNFTGPTCSQAAGSFLQTNLVSCPQRSANFALDISSTAVSEPPSWTIMMFALLLGFVLRFRRRTDAVDGN